MPVILVRERRAKRRSQEINLFFNKGGKSSSARKIRSILANLVLLHQAVNRLKKGKGKISIVRQVKHQKKINNSPYKCSGSLKKNQDMFAFCCEKVLFVRTSSLSSPTGGILGENKANSFLQLREDEWSRQLSETFQRRT